MMSRKNKLALLENIATEAMQGNNLSGRCRHVANAIIGSLRDQKTLSCASRSVLTVYYQDINNDVWDHTVITICIPDRVVVEARLEWLAAESGNGSAPANVKTFIRSLTAWQKEVERRTAGKIVHYQWTASVPHDYDIIDVTNEVEGRGPGTPAVFKVPKRSRILLTLHRPKFKKALKQREKGA